MGSECWGIALLLLRADRPIEAIGAIIPETDVEVMAALFARVRVAVARGELERL